MVLLQGGTTTGIKITTDLGKMEESKPPTPPMVPGCDGKNGECRCQVVFIHCKGKGIFFYLYISLYFCYVLFIFRKTGRLICTCTQINLHL